MIHNLSIEKKIYIYMAEFQGRGLAKKIISQHSQANEKKNIEIVF